MLSIIAERMDTNWFDTHRLIRLAMRNWLAEEGERVAWHTTVVRGALDEIYLLPEHGNKDDARWATSACAGCALIWPRRGYRWDHDEQSSLQSREKLRSTWSIRYSRSGTSQGTRA